MPGVLEVICPTAKAEFCPSGYFVAGREAEGHERLKRHFWTGVRFAMRPGLESNAA
jgi:hypothetical protein